MSVATISILHEILEWSLNRPPWQRDALRRLVTKGELDETDIMELSNLCRSKHGLGDKEKPLPLESNHLPQPDSTNNPVSLDSLTHHAGVNALAQGQTIKFGNHLTIVYGANATGKSGYTRILKRACRARGAEEILGNVVSGVTPGRPSATIKFMVEKNSIDHLWDDNHPTNAFLSRISVFDHHCASVYIAKQTDVAFRPMGLDLFDKLSDSCEAVKKFLEKEKNALESQKHQFPEFAEKTVVYELMQNLTSLTDPMTVKELAHLTETEKAQIKEFRNRIRDLESDEPKKIAQVIELRANRAEELVSRLKTAREVLCDASINEMFTIRDRKNKFRCLVDEMKIESFQKQPLPNTGSDSWRKLWEAAEQFSLTEAYLDHPFPFTGENSRCVLCQQVLNYEGMQRLQQFQEFLSSDVQNKYDAAVAEYQEKYNEIKEVLALNNSEMETLDELQLDDPKVAKTVRTYLDTAATRREKVIEALTKDLPFTQNLNAWSFDINILTNHIENLRNRAEELQETNPDEVISKLKCELNQLEARQMLADRQKDVLEEIERKKRVAAYQFCIDDTRTNTITRKSSEVTKRAVTKQLTDSFASELDALGFNHVEVQMVNAGGSRGALYHKIQLRRAPGVELSMVVSEGEARCLSIASFFAELSTAERSVGHSL